jgi:flagella basal body P-ring formation protein FlgA
MTSLASLALAACFTLPPGAATITAGDLRLEGIDPATVLSLAPAPGVKRVFHFSELARIADRFPGAAVAADDACVERSMAPLDPVKLLAAMQAQYPDARIVISEFSRQLAPPGEIEFRRNGLRNNTVAGATWFGAVRYAPNAAFTIWAKVNLTIRAPRVVAASDLAPGQPIAASQVAIEVRDEFPSTAPFAESLEETVGRYPRIAIRKGSPIPRLALEAMHDVRQGDIVEVDVFSGAAHLRFQARAESSGAVGESIGVRNPDSLRRFIARIESKGKVSVDARAIP